MSRIPPEVLWEDGLFLRPHHLQVFQSHFHALAAYIAADRPFGYGVRTLQVREESIANWVFEVGACDVILPDGTVVIGGENAVIRPVEFRHLQFEDARLGVWLGLPFHSQDAPNLSDETLGVGEEQANSNRRYVGASVERNDENTGENRQPLKVRRLNVRVFVGERPEEGYATLKIAELKKVITDDELGRRYELAKDFVPASLTIESAPALFAAIRDMLDRLVSKHEDLLRPLRGNRAALFGDTVQTPRLLMQLQATNGVLPMLQQIVAQPGMHPFEVYLLMTRLAGDLAIVSDDWEPPKLMVYDHDDALRAYTDLRSKWLELLKKAVDQRVEHIVLRPGADGNVLEATVPDAFFADGVELFLGFETPTTREDIAGHFSGARTSIGDPQDLPMLKRARMEGVASDFEAYVPPDLASRKTLKFLKIVQEGDPWLRVRETKRIGVMGSLVQAGNVKVFLYATNVVKEPGAV